MLDNSSECKIKVPQPQIAGFIAARTMVFYKSSILALKESRGCFCIL